MKKILLPFIFILLFNVGYSEENQLENILNVETTFLNNIPQTNENIVNENIINKNIIDESQYMFFYDAFGLRDKLNYRVFKMALKGFSKIEKKKTDYLVIVDYSQPSNNKRFFVLNMGTFNLEDYTYVAHGKNSGAEMAVSFSNKLNSYKSSVGFYLTGKTYNGRYGYSLKLYGLEEGYNSNAYKRGVVIHGAEASEPEYLKKFGFLGRTEGCPAVPKSLNKQIIEKIREGSVLFIFGNDNKYIRDSKLIK